MKKPKRNDPIMVTVGRRHFGQSWIARHEQMEAVSAVSGESAVSNLALRYFFGGCTSNQGVTDEERKAIQVEAAGGDNIFIARLNQSGGGIRK